MINKGTFKELYELVIMKRYEKIFNTKKLKIFRSRVKLIKDIIINKSKPNIKNWQDFYSNDKELFYQFYKDIRNIKDFSSDIKNMKLFSSSSNWDSSWKDTWRFMLRDLDGLSQIDHNINQGIYREKRCPSNTISM